MVTIVALLSTESPLNLPATKERREEAEAAHRKFAANEGDLVTLLAIWKAFKAGSCSQAWCREHFLVGRHLNFAADIRKQLVGLCRSAEISMESSRDLDNVRKALAHGLFMNVAQLTTEGHWVALDSGQKCHIHPQSVLFRSKPEVVVYTEMVHTSKTYLKVSFLLASYSKFKMFIFIRAAPSWMSAGYISSSRTTSALTELSRSSLGTFHSSHNLWV